MIPAPLFLLYRIDRKIPFRFKKLLGTLGLLLAFTLPSCGKYSLSVFRQRIDQSSLASTHIGSPDPRQKQPPLGQKLRLSWRIDPKELAKTPYLVLDLFFSNHTGRSISYPITRPRGHVNYTLLGEEYTQKGGILTYRARLIVPSSLGVEECVKEWRHQLWVTPLLLDAEETHSATERMSSSVIPQSIQGSVIETP